MLALLLLPQMGYAEQTENCTTLDNLICEFFR